MDLRKMLQKYHICSRGMPTHPSTLDLFSQRVANDLSCPWVHPLSSFPQPTHCSSAASPASSPLSSAASSGSRSSAGRTSSRVPSRRRSPPHQPPAGLGNGGEGTAASARVDLSWQRKSSRPPAEELASRAGEINRGAVALTE
jgi:hypothetical protein